MYCRNCGSQINDSDTYCFNCGAKQNVTVNIQKPVYVSNKPKSVFQKPWFWVLIVVAVISLYSTLSMVFKVMADIDFTKEYNDNNPFDYEDFFEEYEDGLEYNFNFE